MKENIKIIFIIIASVLISSIISITAATTILEANKVSYKTSNGDNVDVNSALDRLFSAIDINARLGNTDISSIGDGTITGAISGLNTSGGNQSVRFNSDTKFVQVYYDGTWYDDHYVGGIDARYLYKDGHSYVTMDSAGYSYNATTTIAATINDDNVYLTLPNNTDRMCCWGTNDIIDVSMYNRFKVVYTYNGVKSERSVDISDVSSGYPIVNFVIDSAKNMRLVVGITTAKNMARTGTISTLFLTTATYSSIGVYINELVLYNV